MKSVEIIYLMTSAMSVVAMAPQIRKLLVTKRSDELSLFTWLIWSGSQVAALVYSIVLMAGPLILVNIIWSIFYMTMVSLIIKYRRRISDDVADVSGDKALVDVAAYPGDVL